jgi:hypothetical protein
MEKSKHKPKREQSPLHRLLFGPRFGFYAPYTLEECAELLLARSERHPREIGIRRKLLVTVKRETPDFYTFRLDIGTRDPYVEVLGALTRDEVSTLVEGRGRIGLVALSVTVLVAVLLLPFLLTNGASS